MDALSRIHVTKTQPRWEYTSVAEKEADKKLALRAVSKFLVAWRRTL